MKIESLGKLEPYEQTEISQKARKHFVDIYFNFELSKTEQSHI